MNVIWSHWGTLYKVEMYRIGPLRPPLPISPPIPFTLSFNWLWCTGPKYFWRVQHNLERTPALYTNWIIFTSPTYTFLYTCVSKYVHLNHVTILHSQLKQGMKQQYSARSINSHLLWYLQSKSKLLHSILKLNCWLTPPPLKKEDFSRSDESTKWRDRELDYYIYLILISYTYFFFHGGGLHPTSQLRKQSEDMKDQRFWFYFYPQQPLREV